MDHLSDAVIHSLREQGYEIHDHVQGPGGMLYGIRSKDHSAWVRGGSELADLAAGRITVSELATQQADMEE